MDSERLKKFVKDLNIKLQKVIDDHEEELLKIVQEELPENHFISNGMGLVGLTNGLTDGNCGSRENEFIQILQELLFYNGIEVVMSLPYFTGKKYTLDGDILKEIQNYVGKYKEHYPYFKKYILTGNYK